MFGWVVLLFLLPLVSGCSVGYQRNGDSFVYVTWDEGRGRVVHPIKGIETQSFQVLYKDVYAKDRIQAYSRGIPIEGSDPVSFVPVSERFSKDAAHVYDGREVVSGADPATFVVVKDGWAKDKNDIYLGRTQLHACDPVTFEVLTGPWARDSRCVYAGALKLDGADPASFVALDYFFAKDRKHVFTNSRSAPIQGADPATFETGFTYVGHARDQFRCYRFEENVDCADF